MDGSGILAVVGYKQVALRSHQPANQHTLAAHPRSLRRRHLLAKNNSAMASSRSRTAGVLLLLVTLLSLFSSSRAAPSLDKKWKLVNSLHQEDRSRPLKLTGATFDQLTSQPRNYSLFVILTTFDPNHRCAMCRCGSHLQDNLLQLPSADDHTHREFDKDAQLVAQAFGRQKDEPRVFLGQLDFADGRQVYSKVSFVAQFGLRTHNSHFAAAAQYSHRTIRFALPSDRGSSCASWWCRL